MDWKVHHVSFDRTFTYSDSTTRTNDYKLFKNCHCLNILKSGNTLSLRE